MLLGALQDVARLDMPGLGRGCRRQASLPNTRRRSAWASRDQRLAGETLDSSSSRACSCASSPNGAKHLPVDGSTAPLHARPRRRIGRPASRRRSDALGRKARFERVPRRGVTSASSAAYSVAFSMVTQSNVTYDMPDRRRAGNRWCRRSARFRQIVHAVAAFAGVEHVGDRHGVVIAADLDAALGERQPVVFQVLADLDTAFSSSSALMEASTSR